MLLVVAGHPLPSEAWRRRRPDQTNPRYAAAARAQRHSSRRAQYDQESAPGGAIIVTGIRRGIQDAIQIKRNSASVVEAVSAEEIGKLPDVSIAEFDRSTPRRHGAARWRSCGDHLHSRLFARLYDGSAKRTPAGEFGL